MPLLQGKLVKGLFRDLVKEVLKEKVKTQKVLAILGKYFLISRKSSWFSIFRISQ
jgi:hypothetical protein